MFKIKAYLLTFLICTTLFLVGCSKYQKLLKSSNMDAKYNAAVVFYNEGDFYKALSLFEELITVYKGTKKAEKVYYYYAYCHYAQKDFVTASFHFDNFAKTFATSEYAEECQFMAAYCYYLDSPGPTLDQESTFKAIKELQLFANKYPKSSKIAQCNDLIDILREKLQTKDYNNAKLYFNTSDYKAAVIALKNLMKDYPGSKYREECLFLITKSYYLLANNSVDTKKEERYSSAVQSYYVFIDAFPQSKYQKEAVTIYDTSVKLKEKYKQSN